MDVAYTAACERAEWFENLTSRNSCGCFSVEIYVFHCEIIVKWLLEIGDGEVKCGKGNSEDFRRQMSIEGIDCIHRLLVFNETSHSSK